MKYNFVIVLVNVVLFAYLHVGISREKFEQMKYWQLYLNTYFIVEKKSFKNSKQWSIGRINRIQEARYRRKKFMFRLRYIGTDVAEKILFKKTYRFFIWIMKINFNIDFKFTPAFTCF